MNQHIETLKQHWEIVMKTLRVSYISECTKLGVTPLSDEEIKKNTYAWKNGDWTNYPEQKRIENQTHTAYYHNMQNAWVPFAAEMEEIRENITPTKIMVTCDCGHTVEKILVMNASLGTSCPNCYDRMSD